MNTEERIEQLESREKITTEVLKSTLNAIEIMGRSHQADFDLLLSVIEGRVEMEFEKYSRRWWLYPVIIPAVITFSVSCLADIIRFLL